MKKLILSTLFVTFAFISSCSDEARVTSTCFNGIQDGTETGVDCGGPDCAPCPTCDDGIQNGGETGIDCGGPDCAPCEGLIVKSGMLTANEKWTSNNIYQLSGKVVVDDGVTLEIEPGTIIKGQQGIGSLASALIVARGGKIMAIGTAENPIVFTSVQDNISIGQKAGTNLSELDQGLWGGVLILGYAPGSFKGDVKEVQIEGIPAGDTYGLYGGEDPEDDSGVFQYVSIRHGGALIGEGNEINGLTLGGVGTGTVINNVEVVANVDDGIEYFGGTVNTENMLVWAQGDDGLDIDQGYQGTISNSVVILGNSSDHGLEIDGPEGSSPGEFTLNNITLIGNPDTPGGEYADYRSLAMGASNNIYAYGFKDAADVELDNNGVSQKFLDGKLTFSNWEIVGFDNSIFVEKVAKDDNDEPIEEKIIVNPDFTERAAEWTTQVELGANTVGADLGDFNWTYAKGKGAF
ncbi:hypothetical protein LCM02_10710 [Lutimonas saemankumensis]|uniref:hypothetical protein n=1 Tax=Lutimonas saemankumensis TaxID=483016 RepID=UPI001CD65459|nr:hypothetical protein [Lutimonas saemankumensis]MCA0932922.1 hypothetical protein [Lutimonas saemankumensis]